MAASVAGRAAVVRALSRASANSVSRVTSFTTPPLRSNFISHPIPLLRSSPFRLVRRELSSFKPVHSAIASACLVSKLPSEAQTASEGRFANYLSPI